MAFFRGHSISQSLSPASFGLFKMEAWPIPLSIIPIGKPEQGTFVGFGESNRKSKYPSASTSLVGNQGKPPSKPIGQLRRDTYQSGLPGIFGVCQEGTQRVLRSKLNWPETSARDPPNRKSTSVSGRPTALRLTRLVFKAARLWGNRFLNMGVPLCLENKATVGCGSKLNHQDGAAGFGPCCHLPAQAIFGLPYF